MNPDARQGALQRVSKVMVGRYAAFSPVHAAIMLPFVLSILAFYPAKAQAGVFDDIRSFWQGKAEASASSSMTVQTLPLLKPAMNIDPNPGKGGGDVTVIDDMALLPQEGPAGTTGGEKPKSNSISIYVVRPNDTLNAIAAMFGVSPNTIKWANEIPPSGTIRVGQTLTILPVTGIKYTTKKGDTVASIAKQFGSDADEITNFNGIEGVLAAGTDIIIPDGEMAAPKVTPRTSSTSVASTNGYFSHPVPGARRTQGIHGYNGVDLAAPVGTPVLASAAGEVIIAKYDKDIPNPWNGGYGNYVVIAHDNGTQTLYAHESSVVVGLGQTVVKGQVIGYVGQTGKATGPHVHFEVRGARNPF